MAEHDDGTNVPIRVRVVHGLPGEAPARIPEDSEDGTVPLTDAATFGDDDESSRYRDPTVLIAGAAGSTFVGVAVDPADHGLPGSPQGGGFDGGGDGGD